MKRNNRSLQDVLEVEFDDDDGYIADNIRSFQVYLDIHFPQETIIDFN